MQSNNGPQVTDSEEVKESSSGNGTAPPEAEARASDDTAQSPEATAESSEDAPEAAEAAPPPSPEEQIAALQTQVSENWDKFLRANAELENVRKRARRDVENAQKYGLERFAVSLLDVCDSMEQGLQRATAAAEARSDDKEVAALVEGMELTAKQLRETLTRNGVRQIEAMGAVFDPELHEAVSAVESAEHPANSVMVVMRQGYTLNDRLLRPAMVVVAKAPSGAETNTEAANPDRAGGDTEESQSTD